MPARKRGAEQGEGPAKKPRVAEATAAASRPRRAAKEAVPEELPKPTTKSSTNKTVTTKKATANQTAKVKSSDSKDNPASAKKAKSSAPSTNTSIDERRDGERCYWLMKAEPESRLEKGIDVKFSVNDLAAKTEPEPWDGVRNPVAQKNMRSMKKGDLSFFYHSNCKVPGIAGIMEIVKEQSVDESAFDPGHPYYDPKSSRDKPRWCVVHVKHVATIENFIPLKTLQQHVADGGPLSNLQVLKMARLSVSKVSEEEWTFILKDLAGPEGQALLKKTKA